MPDDKITHTPDDLFQDADDVWHLGEWAVSLAGGTETPAGAISRHLNTNRGTFAGDETPAGATSRQIGVFRTIETDF